MRQVRVRKACRAVAAQRRRRVRRLQAGSFGPGAAELSDQIACDLSDGTFDYSAQSNRRPRNSPSKTLASTPQKLFHTMPFQTIPGPDVRYALINFDDNGRERTRRPGKRPVQPRPPPAGATDRAFPTSFSSATAGMGDVPAAIDQYNRWIGAMWKLSTIGGHGLSVPPDVHRPALAEPAVGRGIACRNAVSSASAAQATIAPLLETAVEHFGGGTAVRGPAAR